MSTYKINIKSGLKNMHMVNQNTSNAIKHIQNIQKQNYNESSMQFESEKL